MQSVRWLLVFLLASLPAFATCTSPCVAHAGWGSVGGATASGTSSAINTTGATLLVMSVADFSHDSTTDTISDSKGNTWVALTNRVASTINGTIWYVANPTVGSGHTFTCAGNYIGCSVAAFSGVTTTSPFDQENGAATASATTLQPGSITPSQAGTLVVTGLGVNTATIVPGTIDSGFTVADSWGGTVGDSVGMNLAYKVQTSAVAENPTWTESGGAALVSEISSWKASAAASATPIKSGVF